MLDCYNCVYESIYELADSMLECWDNCEDGQEVACVSNYGVIRTLISELILESDGELEIFYSCFDPEQALEVDEFLLVLNECGIFVSPMREEKKSDYNPLHATYLFVHNNCNPKIFKSIVNYDCLGFCFSFEDEAEDECEEVGCKQCCEQCCNHADTQDVKETDGKSFPGFTLSKNTEHGHSSWSFYSTDKNSVDNMLKIVKTFFLEC